MKKRIFGVIVALLVLAFSASSVLANEGIVRLAGKGSSTGRCFAASVYIDSSYKVLLTCRGLLMAQDPVYNKYVVWTQVGERTVRMGEIVSGKMSSNVADRFDNMFVTLEADGFPSKPTGETVLTGKIEPIDFGTGLATDLEPVVTTSLLPTLAVTDRGAVVPTVTPAADTGRLTAMVVGIGRAILFGFILLLIVVGVMSFLARRKNL